MTGFWRFEEAVRDVYQRWGFIDTPLDELLPQQLSKLDEEATETRLAVEEWLATGTLAEAEHIADELADVLIVAIGLSVLMPGFGGRLEDAFFAKIDRLKERSGPFMRQWR